MVYERRVGRLELERTALAKERTMLAYFRTGFASLIFGSALIKLFLSQTVYYIGVGSIILGVFFFLIGFHYMPHRRTSVDLHKKSS